MLICTDSLSSELVGFVIVVGYIVSLMLKVFIDSSSRPLGDCQSAALIPRVCALFKMSQKCHLSFGQRKENRTSKHQTGNWKRGKSWGHIQGVIPRKGLREETPLPLAVGQEERSPKVGTSNCQNNNISQKCNQQVWVGEWNVGERNDCSGLCQTGIVLGYKSMVRHNRGILVYIPDTGWH